MLEALSFPRSSTPTWKSSKPIPPPLSYSWFSSSVKICSTTTRIRLRDLNSVVSFVKSLYSIHLGSWWIISRLVLSLFASFLGFRLLASTMLWRFFLSFQRLHFFLITLLGLIRILCFSWWIHYRRWNFWSPQKKKKNPED